MHSFSELVLHYCTVVHRQIIKSLSEETMHAGETSLIRSSNTLRSFWTNTEMFIGVCKSLEKPLLSLTPFHSLGLPCDTLKMIVEKRILLSCCPLAATGGNAQQVNWMKWTFAEHESDMLCIGTDWIIYGLLCYASVQRLCLNTCCFRVLSILVYCSEILNVQSLELYPSTAPDLTPDSLNHSEYWFTETFIK